MRTILIPDIVDRKKTDIFAQFSDHSKSGDHLTTGHVWTIRIPDLWYMVTEKANKTYCKLNNGTHLKNRHDLKTGHVI